jgi:hypothetical protein
VSPSLGVEILEVVSAGFETGVEQGWSAGDEFVADGEVVIAYQLLKIVKNLWRDKKLAYDEYRNMSAFLNDEPEDGEKYRR